MKFTAFQMLLHRKFFIERRWRVEDVAGQLGVDRSTLYAWIDGQRTCPVDIVPHLFLVTGDIEFLAFCVQGTGYTVAPLPAPEDAAQCLKSEALGVSASAGHFAGLVNEVLKDGHVDRTEVAAAELALDQIERDAEGARKALRQAATRTEPTLRAVK